MARYSLFVLKLPFNLKQTNKLSNSDIFSDVDGPSFQGHGIYEVEYNRNGTS